jgi:hypothetical protein
MLYVIMLNYDYGHLVAMKSVDRCLFNSITFLLLHLGMHLINFGPPWEISFVGIMVKWSLEG